MPDTHEELSPPVIFGAQGARPRRPRISEQALLSDLLRVAAETGRTNLPGELYDQLGQFSSQTYAKRFGSWTAALARVNLQPDHWRNIPREVFLADLRRVAHEMKNNRLRHQDYRDRGQYAVKSVYRWFHCWQDALQAAGLAPVFYRALSQSELLDNLRSLAEKLGRRPFAREITPPLSRFGFKAYKRRFGSLTKAWLALQTTDKKEISYRRKKPRTSRHINLRLRYQVLQRDHFRCRACGRSPAADPQVKLQIDHKLPWSAGGETTLENLQTLCDQCNNGKSDHL
jgi:hypothetical protein